MGVDLYVCGAHMSRRARLNRATPAVAPALSADVVGGQQLTTEGVVGVAHRGLQTWPAEQARFGRRVAGHITVIIQMISGEVGESRQPYLHCVETTLGQPDG